MTYKEAKKILEDAISYNKDGSCKKGSWILSKDGIEAIKIAIELFTEKENQPNNKK